MIGENCIVELEEIFFLIIDVKGVIEKVNLVFVDIFWYFWDDFIGVFYNIICYLMMFGVVFFVMWMIIKIGEFFCVYVYNFVVDGVIYMVLVIVVLLGEGYLLVCVIL